MAEVAAPPRGAGQRRGNCRGPRRRAPPAPPAPPDGPAAGVGGQVAKTRATVAVAAATFRRGALRTAASTAAASRRAAKAAESSIPRSVKGIAGVRHVAGSNEHNVFGERWGVGDPRHERQCDRGAMHRTMVTEVCAVGHVTRRWFRSRMTRV